MGTSQSNSSVGSSGSSYNSGFWDKDAVEDHQPVTPYTPPQQSTPAPKITAAQAKAGGYYQDNFWKAPASSYQKPVTTPKPVSTPKYTTTPNDPWYGQTEMGTPTYQAPKQTYKAPVISPQTSPVTAHTPPALGMVQDNYKIAPSSSWQKMPTAKPYAAAQTLTPPANPLRQTAQQAPVATPSPFEPSKPQVGLGTSPTSGSLGKYGASIDEQMKTVEALKTPPKPKPRPSVNAETAAPVPQNMPTPKPRPAHLTQETKAPKGTPVPKPRPASLTQSETKPASLNGWHKQIQTNDLPITDEQSNGRMVKTMNTDLKNSSYPKLIATTLEDHGKDAVPSVGDFLQKVETSHGKAKADELFKEALNKVDPHKRPGVERAIREAMAAQRASTSPADSQAPKPDALGSQGEVAASAQKQAQQVGLGDLEDQALSGSQASVKKGPYTKEQALGRQFYAATIDVPDASGKKTNGVKWDLFMSETTGSHFPRTSFQKRMVEQIRSGSPEQREQAARYGLELYKRNPDQFAKANKELQMHTFGFYKPLNAKREDIQKFDLAKVTVKPLSTEERQARTDQAFEQAASLYLGDYAEQGYANYFGDAVQFVTEGAGADKEKSMRYGQAVTDFIDTNEIPTNAYDNSVQAKSGQFLGSVAGGATVAGGAGLAGGSTAAIVTSMGTNAASAGGSIRRGGGTMRQSMGGAAISLVLGKIVNNQALVKSVGQKAATAMQGVLAGRPITVQQNQAIAQSLQKMSASDMGLLTKRVGDSFKGAVPNAPQIAEGMVQSVVNDWLKPRNEEFE